MYVLEPAEVAEGSKAVKMKVNGMRELRTQTFFLDAGSVLEVLSGILVAVVACLEFDEFHGKRFA